MFKPRHAYRSPITNRYRGRARGCPVFNNIADVDADMVEQHDECLESLAKIKNRTDLYKTLADNNRPSNNVVKSLQRLSSSASNNRLKTCLQFLIIKVNEKSIKSPQPKITATANTLIETSSRRSKSPRSPNETQTEHTSTTSVSNLRHLNKKQKLSHNQQHKRQQNPKQELHNQLASPTQDQVSSTQDQVVLSHDDQDCQTSPSMLATTHIELDETCLKAQIEHQNDSYNVRSDEDQQPKCSSSFASPHSPISTSSIASTSSTSSSSSDGSSSSCSSSISNSPSPSLLSSPDIINELRRPRLKLSEEKIRKIKQRPVLLDDYYTEHSLASNSSSGCSPSQHSNTTQNSDHSRLGGISTNNLVVHMFQAPPKFVNNLKPCNLPTPTQESPQPVTPPVPSKEMLNCAICGIKDKPPNITKIYGQNSCLLCTRFFATFLKRPEQLFCAQDGDCLMTFDSRCKACWIKICLQKFDIEEDHRKIGQKYSPKLLSSPNVSLITIDTSLSRP